METNETPSDTSVIQVSDTPEMGTPQGTDAISETTPPQTLEDAQKELEALRADFKKVSNESKEHRLKAKELDKLKSDIEASKLSAEEKAAKILATLQAERDTAVSEKQELINSTEVRLQAAQMGIDPKIAAKLIDWSKLEHDDSGNPTNVEDVLKQLVREYPILQTGRQAQPTSGGATNPSRSQSTSQSQKITWELLGTLTQAEYTARSAEIQNFLRDNATTYTRTLK